MIKFFRKIRQNLLSEGKTGKYLKYAIGEIILVVIGILIALSINNWNESRLNDAKTKTYLMNINDDLKTDMVTYQAGIDRLEETLSKVERLMDAEFIYNQSSDSLISYVNGSFHSVRIYRINNSTFLKMTNTGFVENDSFGNLFSDINNYYNKEYKTFSEYLAWDIEVDISVFSHEFLEDWYDKITFSDLIKGQKAEFISDRKQESEVAFKSYIDSPRFRNYNWTYSERKKSILERMKYQKSLAENLIGKINKELE